RGRWSAGRRPRCRARAERFACRLRALRRQSFRTGLLRRRRGRRPTAPRARKLASVHLTDRRTRQVSSNPVPRKCRRLRPKVGATRLTVPLVLEVVGQPQQTVESLPRRLAQRQLLQKRWIVAAEPPLVGTLEPVRRQHCVCTRFFSADRICVTATRCRSSEPRSRSCLDATYASSSRSVHSKCTSVLVG